MSSKNHFKIKLYCIQTLNKIILALCMIIFLTDMADIHDDGMLQCYIEDSRVWR